MRENQERAARAILGKRMPASMMLDINKSGIRKAVLVEKHLNKITIKTVVTINSPGIPISNLA